MVRSLLIFAIGILLALLTVGGFFVTRTFFAAADPQLEPKEITITRSSPTAGEVTFTTEKEAVASIECATVKEGPFSLCGAESTPTTTHNLKTSIILDPEKEYFFVIKIGNTTYDNLGLPMILPMKQEKPKSFADFPKDLLGSCEQDSQYDVTFDMNKDGCIRQNDRDLFTK
ncbi:hypothetical protein HY468_02555 [Candidatus Roizmanbacteria bacterium]|nr:hypothetical protein [Candidatus Roizmanbacteria bacterium]